VHRPRGPAAGKHHHRAQQGDGSGSGDGGGGDPAWDEQVVSVVRRSPSAAAASSTSGSSWSGGSGGGGGGGDGLPSLEAVDPRNGTVLTIALPATEADPVSGEATDAPPVVDACALPSGHASAATTTASGGGGSGSSTLATLQSDGTVRVWQVGQRALRGELGAWRRMYGLPSGDEGDDDDGDGEGVGGRRGGVTYRDADGNKSIPKTGVGAPKHGQEDDEVHVGGNTWAGGTGGSDTAGLGGRGGPYRLDKGHKVHQVSDEAKAEVSEEAAAAAREMGRKGLEERLNAIDMDGGDWATYSAYVEAYL